MYSYIQKTMGLIMWTKKSQSFGTCEQIAFLRIYIELLQLRIYSGNSCTGASTGKNMFILILSFPPMLG